jgi:hypothetical protein
MTNLKDRLDARVHERRAERVISSPSPLPSRSNDPDLEAALARVASGEIAAAYRTPNGALVVTHRSDPANSPAAPEARVGAV